MPARKRMLHTEVWDAIQQMCLWPEQKAYEILRPVVLFGDPPGARAYEAQEKQLKYTSLLANCIILDNTVELSAALNTLARAGLVPTAEHLAALSPIRPAISSALATTNSI